MFLRLKNKFGVLFLSEHTMASYISLKSMDLQKQSGLLVIKVTIAVLIFPKHFPKM